MQAAPYDFLEADSELSQEQVDTARAQMGMWTSEGCYPLLPYSSIVLEAVPEQHGQGGKAAAQTRQVTAHSLVTRFLSLLDDSVQPCKPSCNTKIYSAMVDTIRFFMVQTTRCAHVQGHVKQSRGVFSDPKVSSLLAYCRSNRAGQGAMQSQGMSRGSPAADALQRAVTASQPEISSPPAQVTVRYLTSTYLSRFKLSQKTCYRWCVLLPLGPLPVTFRL